MKIKKNDIYDIKITDLGTHGEGIGKIDGYTLFVKNTLPDEDVKVVVVKANKNYGYGKVIELIKPSPNRITPSLCCRWQMWWMYNTTLKLPKSA